MARRAEFPQQRGRRLYGVRSDRAWIRMELKYICSVCGYVYDPAEHDGVAFADLPEDWRCPRCRQPKEKFNKA